MRSEKNLICREMAAFFRRLGSQEAGGGTGEGQSPLPAALTLQLLQAKLHWASPEHLRTLKHCRQTRIVVQPRFTNIIPVAGDLGRHRLMRSSLPY